MTGSQYSVPGENWIGRDLMDTHDCGINPPRLSGAIEMVEDAVGYDTARQRYAAGLSGAVGGRSLILASAQVGGETE
jgi:hypothetical protein